jgi:hypothetical protein
MAFSCYLLGTAAELRQLPVWRCRTLHIVRDLRQALALLRVTEPHFKPIEPGRLLDPV